MAQRFGGVQHMWIVDETDTFLTVRWKFTDQCILYALDNRRFSTTILTKNQCQRCRKLDFLWNEKYSLQFRISEIFSSRANIKRYRKNGFGCVHTCSSSASTPKLRIPRTVSLSSIDILAKMKFHGNSNQIVSNFCVLFCYTCICNPKQLFRTMFNRTLPISQWFAMHWDFWQCAGWNMRCKQISNVKFAALYDTCSTNESEPR